MPKKSIHKFKIEICFTDLSFSVQKLFDILVDISTKLGKFHEVPYAKSYDMYVNSMCNMYLGLKSYLDEENGIKTPTNVNSYASLSSICSEGYEAINDFKHFSTEDAAFCETPTHQSFASSPIEDASFISNYPRTQSSSSNVIKV